MVTIGPSAFINEGMKMLGIRTDPYARFNFLVELEGLIVGGFTEVTGLQMETHVEEVKEGGVNHFAHKLPGHTSYPANLELRHGVMDVSSLWGWYQQVTRGEIRRRNGTIYLLNQRRIPMVWWNVKGALPVAWNGPHFQANANEAAVETIELIHRGIERGGLVKGALDLAGGAIGSVFGR